MGEIEPLSFFMVLGDNSDHTRKRHSTFVAAKAEANRLASLNPGIKFFVLASVGHAQRSEPVAWTAHDQIPF